MPLRPPLVAVLFSLSPALLLAQDPPCGLGNARLWCADQDDAAVVGTAQADDRFGAALAFGDFDGDGRADLAVGSPGEDDGIANGAGVVHVFYGTGFQLVATGGQVFDQDSVGTGDGGTESGDQFGAALAAGDYDGDGFDDLAIGSPGEDHGNGCGAIGDCNQSGYVHVLFGSASGLTTTGAEEIGQSDFTPQTLVHDDSQVGFALAAIDADDDNADELLVALPAADDDVGRVARFGWTGSALAQESVLTNPLGSTGDRFGWALASGRFAGENQPPRAVAGCPRCDGDATDEGGVVVEGVAALVQSHFGSAGAGTGDWTGFSLAVGDFDHDGNDDLAIGAVNKNHGTGGPENSGRVYVAFGPIENGEQTEFQVLGEDNVPTQTPEESDYFGAALAAGDFDGDGDDDLLVAASGEGVFYGETFLFKGSGSGLAASITSIYNESHFGGTTTQGNRFGVALAAGDLDGDGTDEVAVGVPYAVIGGDFEAGAVYVSRRLDPSLVFLDGFEEDGFASWSFHTP